METKKTKAEKAYNRTLLWRFLRGSKLFFVISMIAAAIAALADLVTPQIVRVAVDNALGGKEANLPAFAMRMVERAGGFRYLGEHIWIFALAILAVAAVKVIAQYAFRVYNTKGAEKLTKTMRDALFGHIEHLPYAWHAKHRTGDIIQRCTSDIQTFKGFISEQLTSIFRIVILLALSIGFMLSMNWKLTLIALIPVPYIILRSLYFHRRIGSAFLACDENEGKLSAMAQENLTGVRVVRAFGREKYERDRFETQNEYYTSLWMKLARPMSQFWSVGDVLSGLQILLIVVFGSVLCIRGEMTAGEYIAFLSYGGIMIWPIRMLGRIIAEMSKAGVSMGRIAYIMKAEEEREQGKALKAPMDGDICFDQAAAKARSCSCSTSSMTSLRAAGASRSAARISATLRPRICAGTSAWCCRSRISSPARSRRTSPSRTATCRASASATLPAPPVWTTRCRALPRATTPLWASAA